MSDNRVTFGAAPLPTNFKGTPQQFFEAILARMYLLFPFPTFVVSDTEPTSNQGPWLKGGTEWWVWDDDAAKYVPQELSYLLAQIYVGESQPDPADYKMWLETDGITIVALHYYFGLNAGWVSWDLTIKNGSITHEMLGNGIVQRENIASGEVTADKLQNEVPVAKLANGTARQTLRTAADGTTVAWDSLFTNSGNKSWSPGSAVTFAHGLGMVPAYVRAVLVCVTAQYGFQIGDEVSMPPRIDEDDPTWHTPQLVADAVNVTWKVKDGVKLYGNPGGFWADNTHWKVKIYVAA